MGRGIIESGLFRTERVDFEERTTDPSETSEGEMWIRTDVAPDTDQLATLRMDTGSGERDIPIYDTAASTTNVAKAWRVRVAGATGFVPITDDSPAYNDLKVQHNGSAFCAHDALETSAIPDSVVARWKLNDDTDTTTATDSQGSNDGTINGATYTTTAQEGSHALSFDGTDDDVGVSTVNAIHVGESPPNTVSFVIKATGGDPIGNWNGDGWAIVSRDNDSDGSDELTWLNRSDGSTFTRSFADINIWDGNWYHVVVVNNDGSASAVDFYVNDVERTTNVESSGTATGASGSSTTDIGQRGDGSQYVDGILDDVIIADDAWTSQEVSDVFSLYNI